jgi:hypothetical protein
VNTVKLSDAEYGRRMREAGFSGFLELARLLGDDVKAAKAMREESEFVRTHSVPHSNKFAAQVRSYLLAHKLEWTQENLEKAIESVNQ